MTLLKLKIILQGGGTRCAYQMAFLKYLIDSKIFTQKYEVIEVYGTSFGALVGYFLCINRLDILHHFFLGLTLRNLKPWFDFWGVGYYLKKLPLLGNLIGILIDCIWILMSISKKSLFDQSDQINKLCQVTLSSEQKGNLHKFNCCVYNITQQKTEYIRGDHPYIVDYIKASSSLWLVFKPMNITRLKSECLCDQECLCLKNEFNLYEECNCLNLKHKHNEFMDGAIMTSIPLFLDLEQSINSEFEYLILATKDIEQIEAHNFSFHESGNNLFEYLDHIITFLIDNHQYAILKYINKDWHRKENIKFINYKPKVIDPTIVNQEIIEQYILDGKKMAQEFISNL
jgi:predicted acylesterase/phospholipase RssA